MGAKVYYFLRMMSGSYIFSAKKKVVVDIGLNIIAAALPIAMLQLFIYPRIANKIGGAEYGLLLTIYAIWIMIPNSLGNVLNNIRLLHFPEYETLGEEGDIAILLRQWLILSTLIVFFVTWVYCGVFSFTHILLGIIIASFILLKAYLEVAFRIELNYTAVLINNVLLCIGFYIGYVFFNILRIWEMVFLCGYACSLIYCIFKTSLLNERPKKTNLFFKVQKDAYSLLASAVIKNLTVYADKLVLYPLMGGMVVSVYYTATLLGKIIGMLTGPLNSVVLSYISRWDTSKATIFTKVLLVGMIVSVFGYFTAILIARPVVSFLFPQWVEAVMEILPLTTITIMLSVLISLLQPFVLKFCKMQWQIGISAVGSAVYFGSALFLWIFMGLKGFCIGTIIGNFATLVTMLIAYYSSIRRLT